MGISALLHQMGFTVVGIDTVASALMIVGGVVYLLGVVFFINGRPRLAPRVFSHHEIWHVVVIVASVVHFVAVWRVISVS
ncbi:MAG: hemolysin III family protein [Acidimicrobiia bacterium]